MKTMWHRVSFTHSCGRQGTVLEICIARDGGVSISGICVLCGVDFTIEDTMMNLVSKAAIGDYEKCRCEQPEELLANFHPVGKPH